MAVVLAVCLPVLRVPLRLLLVVAREAAFLLHRLRLAVLVAEFHLRRQAVLAVYLRWVVFPLPAVRAVYHRRLPLAAALPLAEVMATLSVAAGAPVEDREASLQAGGADNKVADSRGSIPADNRASRDSRNKRGCDNRCRRRASACPIRSPSRSNCC